VTTIVGAHLLAFPDDSSRCLQREAQALVLQGILRPHLLNGSAVICLGDFNDFDLQVPDVKSSRPISRTLSFLKDIVSEKDGEVATDELVNIAQNVVQQQRFTAYYNPNKSVCLPARNASSSIDHVLISDCIQRLAKITSFDNNAFKPPCASTQHYSDHWPVFVKLQM
jgi:exonuclease III